MHAATTNIRKTKKRVNSSPHSGRVGVVTMGDEECDGENRYEGRMKKKKKKTTRKSV